MNIPAVARPLVRRLSSWGLVLLVLLIASSSPPIMGGVLPGGARVSAFKAGHDATRARLVVEFVGPAAPVCEVSYRAADASVVVDMRNVEAVDATLPPAGGDPFLKPWSLARPNFRQVTWTIPLAWPVPADHVRSQLLQNPTRLVVDVGRGFHEDLRLRVTRNVSWRRQEVRTETGGYVLLNELEVEHPGPGVSLGLLHARDSLSATEKPSAMAGRKNVLALINGGFFRKEGGPLGVVVDQGRILAPHVATRPPRTALGLTRSGRIIMGRVAVQDGRLVPVDGGDWSDVTMALGGGPRLVQAGRAHLTTDAEGLGPKGNNITRTAGRTAVALLSNGHLLFLTVSGYRDNHSEGWKLTELADWLVRRGAVEAMGLDGGGSTAMVVQGQTVSRPAATTYERPVANALALADASPVLLPGRVRVVAALHKARADGTQSVRVVATVDDSTGKPVPDGTRVYFACSRGGITATAPTTGGRAVATWRSTRDGGEARIYAFAGLAWGEDTIRLEEGPPARIVTRVVRPALASTATAGPPVPTPAVPLPPALEILVTDEWHNPLEGQDVKVEVSAPAGDRQVVMARTGTNGVATVSLPGAGTVRVMLGGLAPVEVPLP